MSLENDRIFNAQFKREGKEIREEYISPRREASNNLQKIREELIQLNKLDDSDEKTLKIKRANDRYREIQKVWF